MKRKLTLLFSSLLILILLVWAVFYTIVSRQIRDDAQYRAQLAADQIVDNLGAELAELEYVSVLLSGNESLVHFTQETDASAYYAAADEVSAAIAANRVNMDFIGSIIVFDNSGAFYRFSGNLSNTSCARVWHLAAQSVSPEHILVKLEYQNYVGYVSVIYNEAGARCGTLVMLAEEARILELIRESALGDSLMVAVTARGELVTTNFPQTQLPGEGYIATRHIGLTPFEILVSDNGREVSSSPLYFTVAAVVTALFFALLIFTFIRQMNRRFLAPMFRIMGNAQKLDWAEGGSYLPSVQNEEFDMLISRINEMLARIERQSGEIKTAELRATNAELQKQKAIIFSLKKQINAHFVINTLSTIRVLVEQGDVARAETVTKDLSMLIRYAYEKDDLIGIWNELQALERYVTIMNVRYANKIEVIFDVDDRLMDVLIPRMLLQPIVENAIVHGFKSKREGCEIRILAAQEDKRIVLSICDNGAGMGETEIEALTHMLESSPDELPEGIENIALINIRRQLYAHYGENASLKIRSIPREGTEITLTLPYDG